MESVGKDEGIRLTGTVKFTAVPLKTKGPARWGQVREEHSNRCRVAVRNPNKVRKVCRPLMGIRLKSTRMAPIAVQSKTDSTTLYVPMTLAMSLSG